MYADVIAWFIPTGGTHELTEPSSAINSELGKISRY